MKKDHGAAELFAQSRQEKRQVFCAHWNTFLKSPLLLANLIALSGAQVLFFLLSLNFLRETALAIGIIKANPDIGTWAILLVIQLGLAVPGTLVLAGLWHIRSTALWQGENPPTATGVAFLQKINNVLCVIGGISVFLYPTVTITAGEYLPFSSVLIIFYLFFAVTVLTVMGVSLVRVNLRQLGENVECCWCNTKLTALLWLSLFACGVAILLLLPLTQPFYWVASAMCILFGFLVLQYDLVMRKITVEHAAIEYRITANRNAPYDDPYNRY